MVPVNQLRVEKRDCERMRVQVVHNRVALNNSNASADSGVSGKQTTQLKRGKSLTVTMTLDKLKRAEFWQLEKRDVRIKSWKARVIQSGALGAKRECLSKLVARLKHDRSDDDADDVCNEEVLCDCFFLAYIVSHVVSPTRRRTKFEVPDHMSRVKVANEQCPQFEVVCSQTPASRISSKNSSFALDAG